MKHTEMIEVIQAHSEGKAIQGKSKFKEKWLEIEDQSFNFVDYDYRVKPEPVYKTFDVGENGCLKVKHHCLASDKKYVEIKALEDAMGLLEGRTISGDELMTYGQLRKLL